jgi:hypothetical protein
MMDELASWSRRAVDCLAEASEMRQKIAEGLGAELDGDDAGKHHAVLEIRSLVEAASGELSVAWQRMAILADRLSALAAREVDHVTD